MYYLYLFKFIDNTDSSLWFKIGITKNVDRRMKEIFKDINAEGPLELQTASADIDMKEIKRIEQSALKLFPPEDFDNRDKTSGSTEMRLLRKDGKKYRRYKHVKEAFNIACKYAERRGIRTNKQLPPRSCNIM